MSTIKEVADYLESLAPLHLQESYDNSGLLVGDPGTKISSILISLDCTPEIIAEAVTLGCNMVIAHHPIIFSGLKRLNGSNYIERTVIDAIKNDVAIYAIHTNLDSVQAGVNGRIADLLDLNEREILQIGKFQHDDEATGAGMIGFLSSPLSEIEFLNKVKKVFDVGCVRHTDMLGKPVSKVAICGGSGSFLINSAIESGADVFLTADIKYHQFFDADGKLMIVDIGHYESEQYTKQLLHECLSDKFNNFAVHLTSINTNPVNYL